MNKDGTCAEVLRRDRGRSEVIIEEFMLTANTAAAKLAKEKAIPFIYRIHEKPAAEKVDELMKKVSMLGIKTMSFRTVRPKHIADILKKTKDTPFAPAINSMALRSMAKAKYSEEPLGHFGLVLNDYSHFTSPIRRYPDLAIHRILNDLCHKKLRAETLQKRYAGFVKEASEISSSRELGAMRFERSCEDIIMAEYMHSRIGESFEGMIAAVADFGFYVELPNTIRGLVRIESLGGQYEYDGNFGLTNNGKPAYSVGDKIKVICSGVQISFGRIDFDVDGQLDNLRAKKT
jgi:ribonuclease R